jgi:hypothetical protein
MLTCINLIEVEILFASIGKKIGTQSHKATPLEQD